jgi:DNA-binding response OmpR family regulator
LALAHNNTERLILLVNDLLDVEKIQAGKIDLNLTKTNLTALVKESIAMNQTYASDLKIRLELAPAVENYFIKADPNRLLQVMANLISNAAKYSPIDEVIKINITAENNFVKVSVSDNGLGIPAEYRGKIFQKFSQLDASDSRKKGGTGLGLNITKAIIDHHGGHIDFVSKVNKGTTFFFKLPLWQEIEKISRFADAPQLIATKKHSAGRILVLEDEPDIANLLTFMLEQHSFQVTSCGLARQAKALLLKEYFDLITVDIRLPDQDGLSFIKELRANDRFKNLAIVIISAEADSVKKHNVTSGLQVIDWIEKPIDQNRLLASVNASIHKNSKILYIEDDIDLTQMMTALLGEKMTVISANTLHQAKQILRQEQFDLIVKFQDRIYDQYNYIFSFTSLLVSFEISLIIVIPLSRKY